MWPFILALILFLWFVATAVVQTAWNLLASVSHLPMLGFIETALAVGCAVAFTYFIHK